MAKRKRPIGFAARPYKHTSEKASQYGTRGGGRPAKLRDPGEPLADVADMAAKITRWKDED